MAKKLIGAWSPGDVPGDDATDEEIDAWAEALTNSVFESPSMKAFVAENTPEG